VIVQASDKVFGKKKNKISVFRAILIVAKDNIFNIIAKKVFFIIAEKVGHHTKRNKALNCKP